jgi:hypothetical protein
MHFIYKDKEKLIQPYIPLLLPTWDILLQNPRGVACHTIFSSGTSISAICSSWRSSTNGWCVQNGVAYNIRDYVRAIVSQSYKLIEDPSVSYIQTWFRPGNTIVCKMCGLDSPLCNIDGVYSDVNSCLLWTPKTRYGEIGDLTLLAGGVVDKTAFKSFIIDNRSSLFYEEEDLADDPSFENVNKLFYKAGLTNRRKIDVISSSSGIQAVILSYFSSPGINFSFLENRTEVIVGRNVAITSGLIALIGETVRKRKKERIVPSPIITERRTGNALISNGAILQREYERYIWTKDTYKKLYEYITNKYM